MLTRSDLAPTLRPLLEASTLPAASYVAETAFELEQRVFLKQAWHQVGRSADAALPGTWFRVALDPWDLIVVRGDDLVLRAFHTACRHRGLPLVNTNCGVDRVLTCPYHGFSYALNGQLVSAPHTEQLRDFKPAQHGLLPAKLEEWGGFVFVCTDNTSTSLARSLGRPPAPLDQLDLAKLVRGRRTSFETRANWKLVIGNFQESHHFTRVHPELEARTPWRDSSSFYDEGPWFGGRMDLDDAVETVSEDGARHGRPFLPSLPAGERRRVTDVYLWPLSMFSVQPDYLLAYALFPLAPDRTRVTAEIFFAAPCAVLPHGSVDAPDVFAFWDRVNAQDRDICERQQRGISSGAWQRGRYVEVEDGLHAFEQRVARLLDAALRDSEVT